MLRTNPFGGGGFAGGTRGAFGGGAGGFGGDSTSLNAVIRYADAHGGGTIGVESQGSAATEILSKNANIAGLGGFSGRESSVTASWIAMEVLYGPISGGSSLTIPPQAPGRYANRLQAGVQRPRAGMQGGYGDDQGWHEGEDVRLPRACSRDRQ